MFLYVKKYKTMALHDNVRLKGHDRFKELNFVSNYLGIARKSETS